MDILNMEAGRELDVEVERNIFGTENVKMIDLLAWPKGYYKNGDITNPVPLYSTDISAAWEVVEKMDESGWDLRIIKSENYREVAFGAYTVLKRDVPEAICKAALLALQDPESTE